MPISNHSPVRVLFVEDDKVDRMAFRRAVDEEHLPYDYVLADSCKAGLAALKEGRFDVIVSDYKLGDGTAFELLAATRAVPVIFITGSGSEETAVRALRSGAADHIIKDSAQGHLRILPVTIERAVRRTRSKAQLEKLRHAVEQNPVAVMITNATGDIEYVNPKFALTTGYSTEDVVGANPRILKSGEHSPEFYRELWNTILSGQVWRGDIRNCRKDRTLYWEHVSTSPVRDDDGRITHFVSVREDVTAKRTSEQILRESEENFRALATNARDASSYLGQRRPQRLRKSLGRRDDRLLR